MMARQVSPRSTNKHSIPTEYKNILFRSKLEADWARAFDALGVEWEYEKKGQYFGDVFYLVDFWLPRSRQYVEVKGVFEPSDCRKIHALTQECAPRLASNDESPDIVIVAAVAGGDFYGWAKREGKNQTPSDWLTWLRRASREVHLCRCFRCSGWWFADMEYSWACQCCGAHRTISQEIVSPLVGFGDDLTILRRIGGAEADI